jgi:pyridoxine/pyridoxamine 5'-phosphate oxidase
METDFETPEDLWKAGWKLLARARADKKHAYATPAVSSVDEQGFPTSRVLVLRNCDSSTCFLEGYTDRRAAKALHLRGTSPQFSWLFWDPKKQLQFRARGRTKLLPREVSAARFDQLPKHSRKAYATPAAPGSPLLVAGDGLPQNWPNLELGETDYARENFAIFRTEIEEADLLLLNRSGHRRVSVVKQRGGWTFRWIVP